MDRCSVRSGGSSAGQQEADLLAVWCSGCQVDHSTERARLTAELLDRGDW